MIEQLGQHGCAICRLLERDTRRLLDSIAYEFVTDPQIQGKFRASRGLCSAHGKVLLEQGNALGVAVLYKAVLHEVLGLMEEASGPRALTRRLRGKGRGDALAQALDAERMCIACEGRAEGEARFVRVFCDAAGDQALRAAFAKSDGMCLEHLRLALRGLDGTESNLTWLVTTQRGIWERLFGDLEEFIRKNDYRFRHEPMGAEGDSWRRVVLWLSGGG